MLNQVWNYENLFLDQSNVVRYIEYENDAVRYVMKPTITNANTLWSSYCSAYVYKALQFKDYECLWKNNFSNSYR